MKNIEIMICNIKKEYIDLLINKDLELTLDLVISSHFYDKVYEKDIELSDIVSLEEYYSTPNTGNIFAKEVVIGDKINNVMIIMSFDNNSGDIVMNFEEEEFISSSKDELKQKFRKIIVRLAEICTNYEIEEVRIGYEPASDDDMLLLLINKNGLYIINEFNCLLSNVIRSL